MPPDTAGAQPATTPWDTLRGWLHRRDMTVLEPSWDGQRQCVSCCGPVRPGYPRCFQCGLHEEVGAGMLADVVAPVAYAHKGGQLARDLWVYKSAREGAAEAGTALLTSLLVFLHDHGPVVWQRAGMPGPTHACVVPSGRGRPGPHPLRVLVRGCLALPWVSLAASPGGDPWARLLDPDRFAAQCSLAGAGVLLLDDTWTSGATAQSAALALKRAGARQVAVVVLGRHTSARTPPGQ
ncbi:MAG TPA: phosphoribosyltransferase [Streptosporangiaceae bacterium]|nr:phosphoribosyltransferase [Streptosporangiaceae bacterium]